MVLEPLGTGFAPGRVVAVAPGDTFPVREARAIPGVAPDLASAVLLRPEPSDPAAAGSWHLAVSGRYLSIDGVSHAEQRAVCDAVADGPAGPATRECRWRLRCIRDGLDLLACIDEHPIDAE